ncbi:hypothetical protein AOQ84DRAFT_424782 [Glonium stellatum]|uniref:Uncharacterized protein n=1 Tax=Glonium stellatum TaxID=574774 RepID=A0A8E2F759_9PEZI|nr:hypothetical protein AOQ84DRAFT_424782 [Glonium stellatum]
MVLTSTNKPRTKLLLLLLLFFIQSSLTIPTPPELNNGATNTSSKTLPASNQPEVKWQPSPNTRGTLSIILSCVITLFLCIWTTVFVNIEPKDSKLSRIYCKGLGESWLGKFLAHKSVRKAGWSCVTLVVPEITLAIAAHERMSAAKLTDVMVHYKKRGWDNTLSYYVIIGGFALSPGKPPSEQPDKQEDKKKCTLTPQGIVLLHLCGKLPDVRREDINDRSKTNHLARFIVSIQALWMIISVCGRAANHLSVTPLELHTCLHTFCALATYFMWWNKPVDLQVPTEITVDGELLDELGTKRHGTARSGGSNSKEPQQTPPGLVQAKNRFTFYLTMMKNAYHTLHEARTLISPEGIVITVVGFIYGAVHLAVWNTQFPSYLESRLWRIASGITAISWGCFVLSMWIPIKNLDKGAGKDFFITLCVTVLGTVAIPYVIVRLFLLVESFAAMRLLPPDAYTVSRLSALWPHSR